MGPVQSFEVVCTLCWAAIIFGAFVPKVVDAGNVMEQNDVQRVIPERLDSHRHRRDLSTYTKTGHDDEATFLINAYDKAMVLQTKRNKNLLSPTFTVGYFNNDNSEVNNKATPEHCYYQGTLKGKPDSMVVLNTCHGLSGLIDDEENVYHIEPDKNNKQNGGHIVYPARDDQGQFSHHNCGNNDEAVGISGADRDAKVQAEPSHHRRLRRDVDEFYREYLTTNETRYVEVMFVADFEMFLRHNNDTKALTDRVIVLANAVDAIYQRINIRLVMVGLEIWTNGDRTERQRSGGAELTKFTNYRKKHLIPKIHHDNAQFLSHRGWEKGVAGMAYVTAMCVGHSTGVNAVMFMINMINDYNSNANDIDDEEKE